MRSNDASQSVMAEPVAGLRQESQVLADLLAAQDDAQWEQATQFKQWTFNDVLAHLMFFDTAATLTLRDEPAFLAMFAQLKAALASGTTSLAFSHQWIGGLRGPALLAAWRANGEALAQAYEGADPRQRVKWAGPDMSVRSCLSARLMENWAHAQAIYDQLGRTRVHGDYIRSIAELGVNTYRWTFANRSLPVPEPQPAVRLTAPSGALWEWGGADPANSVQGSAVEFCQVVTQTRNVADTALRVVGDAATRWMSFAQCFAGPPRDAPAPGTRYARQRA